MIDKDLRHAFSVALTYDEFLQMKNLEDRFLEGRKAMLFNRLKRWGGANGKNNKAESSFCDYIEPRLTSVFDAIGYKVQYVAREFIITHGRIDFLVQAEGDRLVVVEVKHSNVHSNDDLSFSFAVGQVLTYRSVLSAGYGIDREKIDGVIITDVDSALTNLVCQNEAIRVRHVVVGDGEASFCA